MIELPGVGEDGMSGRNVQRKLGTTRGSPRRSRTAKASRISRRAVKSRCAREWGGWGRLSDDGPGQNNPDPSEGPWGRWSDPPHGGALSSPQARLRADHRSDHEVHEGRMQTGWRTANAGSRLKLLITQEGTVWKASLPAVLRENPPYGMIGGIEETSASFEARSAPRSYPTALLLKIETILRVTQDALKIPSRFDPASSTRSFRLAGNDHVGALIAPSLFGLLRK